MPADGPIRRKARPGLKPLRRKPKVLDTKPTLHRAEGTGPVVTGGKKGKGPAQARGKAAPGFTEESGTLLTAASNQEADPRVLARAREIANRLALPRPSRQAAPRRGPGELTSVKWRGSGDEIDLDASLEALLTDPHPQDEDIIVREYVRRRRAIVLLIDVSGSMRGERIRTAAATVGALAAEFERDDLAVVAFGSDATMLSSLGDRIAPRRLLDALLGIPARGLTNVAFPLEIAGDELARSPLQESRVLLLSDCVHNAGPDPRTFAARLKRLDVLVDTSGEHDLDLARDLARLGHGRLAAVPDHRRVAPAITRFFCD